MKALESHGLLAVVPAIVGVGIELYRVGGNPPVPPTAAPCPDCRYSSQEVIDWLQEREGERLIVGGVGFALGVVICSLAFAARRRYGRQASLAPRRRGGGIVTTR